jgi:hypothetical protein
MKKFILTLLNFSVRLSVINGSMSKGQILKSESKNERKPNRLKQYERKLNVPIKYTQYISVYLRLTPNLLELFQLNSQRENKNVITIFNNEIQYKNIKLED